MKAPTQVRTADVLAEVGHEPTRAKDIAAACGVSPWRISGHLAWLVRGGFIARTRVRGYYVRTARGDQHLATVRLPERAA